MNKIYTIFLAFLLVCSVSTAFAQVPLQIETLKVEASVKSTDQDISCHTNVKSTAAATTNWDWVREVVGLPATWQTQVCDPNLCWSSAVSSGTFSLEAGQEFPLVVHFKPNGTDGSGIVYVTLTEVGNPANSVKIEYNANGYTASTASPTDFSSLKMFPNPVRDHFSLENVPSAVKNLSLTNLEGRRMCHFEMTTDMRFDIPDYEAGTYLLSLEDAQGRSLKTIPLQKL